MILGKIPHSWPGTALFLLSLMLSPHNAIAANGAINFDGIDDMLQVQATSVLKPTSQVAVEAWIKTTKTDTNGADVISMADSYALRIKTTGAVSFYFYDGTTWQTVLSTSVNVLDGAWHHLVGQKSSSALEIYVDGVKRGTVAGLGSISYYVGGGSLRLGRHGNTSNAYDFTGLMDEVRIYSRTLSSSEVNAHFGAGAGQYGLPEAGLVAGYHFDEGAGQTTADFSGNGQPATLSNGATWTTGLVNSIQSDTIPPSGSITINGGVTATRDVNVLLTINATDNSGVVSQMRFSNDDKSYSPAEPFTTTPKSWTLSTGDGTKTVYVRFADPSGNWSATVMKDTIVLDTTAPKITFVEPSDGKTILVPGQ